MKVYFDLLFLLNVGIDFLLLYTLNLLLKRKSSIKRILCGSLVGGCSIFCLFFIFSSFSLFLFKLFVACLMILVTFPKGSAKVFFQNLGYLYLLSIFLGGILTFFKGEISYHNQGLLFASSSSSFFLVFLFLSPLFFYLYVKIEQSYKMKIRKRYRVDLYYQKQKYLFTAFLDTGNHIKDPYRRRPVILVSTDKIRPPDEKTFLVPCHSATGEMLLRCVIVDKIVVDKTVEVLRPVIALVPDDFAMDGVDMILNNETLGG